MTPRRFPLLTFVFLVMAALACNVPGGAPTPTPTPILPTVSIVAPVEGAAVNVGQRVEIRSRSADTAGGVTRVELRADGTVIDAQEPEAPKIAWTVQQTWTPATAGAHTIEVIAYRGTVASIPATLVLTAAGTVTVTPPPPSASCIATTNTNLNFRDGPGTNYPSKSVLAPNTALAIVGRLGDNSWWQVRTTGGEIGWVAADYTDESGNCVGVPVVQPPPPPTNP
ncbi:MAG: Ig-like domain-containing protein [Anaerolineae bacterium]|nr:Ig-like domain-containing protein [Anaerolineae bacterium]